MARTLDEVLVELNAAYIARAELFQRKVIVKARFSSAESTRHYEFSDIVTASELQGYIALLEAERDMLMGTPQVFRTNDYVPMTYRKGGV